MTAIAAQGDVPSLSDLERLALDLTCQNRDKLQVLAHFQHLQQAPRIWPQASCPLQMQQQGQKHVEQAPNSDLFVQF